MDYSIEQHFVQTFIRKNRRERLLFELTDPDRRYDGISRFCHRAGTLLEPSRIVMQGEDLDRRPEFERFVRRNGGICLVLSPDCFLGEQMLPLDEAVSRAVQCPDAVLILGKDFAVVFGEPMKGGRGKYLLAEDRPARRPNGG